MGEILKPGGAQRSAEGVLLYLAMTLCAAAALGACSPAPPIIESTSRLGNTTDTVGPYQVETVVLDTRADDKVEVFYNVDNQIAFIPLLMTEQEGGELFIGAIPGRPAGSRISYFVAVSRDGQRLVADPDSAAALPYSFVIESPPQDVP